MKKEIEIFENYVKDFDSTNELIINKHEHTYRVVEYAKMIAKSLNLNEEDYNLACICALFHDIGRFNQAKFYNNLKNNVNEFDHGDEGYKVLKELDYNNEIVLESTRNHNKYKVDESLDDRTKFFSNITRDADKLDILITQYKSVDKDDKVKDKLYEDLLNKRLVLLSDVSNKSEMLLLGLSQIYDVNFKKTFEIIDEHNIIDEKINIFKEYHSDERIDEVARILKDYIKERIK